MRQLITHNWRRTLGLGLLQMALVGCSFLPTQGALAQERLLASQAQERVLAGQNAAAVRFEQLAVGFQRGGTLGFSLRETAIEEQLFRRDLQGEQSLLWNAQFQSRWTTSEDQLDRWSAQVIGLLADNVAPNVRLAGWERLSAADLGDTVVAYRYLLATAGGEVAGEATVAVYARGAEVGMTGVAAVGSRLNVDAPTLARAIHAPQVGS